MEGKKRILVTPLNWGLGHASRCIPLIKQYLDKGDEVIIASNGDALEFLRKEFPQLESHVVPSYRIHYSSSVERMTTALVSQSPRFLLSIYKERRWLRRFLKTNHLDLVISDNRYGLYSKKVKSVIITHQLTIKTPLMSSSVNQLNRKLLNRFDECWVPDQDDHRLSGDLSVADLKVPVRFIGPLSRMKRKEGVKKDIKILAILSGPEPQRTILEEKLLPILAEMSDSVLVRGLVSDTGQNMKGGVKVIGHLLSDSLQDHLDRSYLVVCRSGYSSLMDLDVLGNETILIPTPGQPEQEYLASRLHDHPQFSTLNQSEIDERLPDLISSSLQRISLEG